MSKPTRRVPFYARVILGMVLGAILGEVFGPRIAPIGEAGRLIIQLIKALAAPLLFLAIVEAFVRSEIRGRAAIKLLSINAVNTCAALVIGLGLANWLKPGVHLREAVAGLGSGNGAGGKIEGINFGQVFAGYIPESVVKPFVENSVVSIIGLAVLLGLALRSLKNREQGEPEGLKALENGIATLFEAVQLMLHWVIQLVPIAVLCVVAKTLGVQGLAPLKGLAWYVGVALLGLTLQVVVVYQAWIVFVSRFGWRRFWKGARDPVVYAMGASSSLATLPVTLEALDEMGVSRESARLAACVGTNLNNDGILLYEATAVLIVAQAYGVDLSIGQQAIAAFSCVLAGIGIAGVPDAGLISLAIVLATVGLPVEIVPLLLTVDWILSRARAVTNVIADLLVSVLLDRFADSTAAPPRYTSRVVTSPAK